jgi:hypothetical protein
MATIEEFKCYNCGKLFRDATNLRQHKARKTPCLIREITPEQAANPNRCIFCNKIFANIGNKNKHLKTCKVKNGGMDMLVDKVRYDQEIRILKERMERKDKEMEQKDKQMEQLREEMDALKQAIIPAQSQQIQTPQTINNYNGPVNNINITINNYTSPATDGLTITPADLASVTSKLSKYLLEKLYFNPALPQNHCLYLKNIKDKSLIVFDNNKWEAVCGENTSEVITKLNNVITTSGSNLLNGSAGPYKGTDGDFINLPTPDQTKLIRFNRLDDILNRDDAYEVFLGGRSTVLGTIRQSGCELV